MSDENPVEAWAIVEVMGHRTYAGRVTERRIAGAGFVQIDIPEAEGREATTKLLGTSSIFALHLTTEERARAYADRVHEAPIDTFARLGVASVAQPAIEAPSYSDDDEISW